MVKAGSLYSLVQARTKATTTNDYIIPSQVFLLTLSLSSWLVSRAHERYHVSLFFSLASLSYFSSVRLSTWPVRYLQNKTSQMKMFLQNWECTCVCIEKCKQLVLGCWRLLTATVGPGDCMWSELLAKEKFSLFSLLQTGVAASRYWPHHLHVNSDGSHTDWVT